MQPLGVFRSKKAEVLNHWISLAEGFQLSSSEFYDSIERELESLQVPGLQLSRVDFAEGGLLSDKRVYLRMARERLIFDICAAPFGTSFFFSCRMAEIPSVIRIWQLIVLLGLICTMLYAAIDFFGIIQGSIVVITFIIAMVWTMRNTVASGLHNLDAMLVKSPLIGPIYEKWIRKETYYRLDTRLMYIDLIPNLVRRRVEEVTSANGIKLVRQYERAPILGDLYKPVLPRTETGSFS